MKLPVDLLNIVTDYYVSMMMYELRQKLNSEFLKNNCVLHLKSFHVTTHFDGHFCPKFCLAVLRYMNRYGINIWCGVVETFFQFENLQPSSLKSPIWSTAPLRKLSWRRPKLANAACVSRNFVETVRSASIPSAKVHVRAEPPISVDTLTDV